MRFNKYHRSRRSFILDTTGVAGLLSAASTSPEGSSSSQAAEAPENESYWSMVRRQFAFSEKKVPMNAANLCPSPRVVSDRVTELTRDIDVDCSFNNRGKFAQLLEISREKVAKQLGVTPDEIALVRNTSEANNTINNGLPLPPGAEILLWDQNHPTNNVAWDVRAARFGFSVKRVATPPKPEGISQLIDVFKQALSAKTRVLAITHVSNVSGIRLPVRELCELAHERGIHVHVDGAQSWGALNVDLRMLNCDSYSASAHKWFVGPKEVGLLYVRKERIPEIWPNVVAPGWGSDIEPDVRGARRFESMGQRDDAALATIGDTIDFHTAIGPDRVEKRIDALANRLKSELSEAGFNLVTPLDPRLSAGVVIITAANDRRMEVFNRLYDEHGIAGSTTGGLRLCPHLYNTDDHIGRALEGVKAMRELMS